MHLVHHQHRKAQAKLDYYVTGIIPGTSSLAAFPRSAGGGAEGVWVELRSAWLLTTGKSL